ncbi:hypothetical protein L218DRAFT_1006657 [Marasmius fiardii PR-910]|nr:hypothetical protein L218DRAFT_1006657 [Marasmius fiardii PR-910]
MTIITTVRMTVLVVTWFLGIVTLGLAAHMAPPPPLVYTPLKDWPSPHQF